MAKELDIEKILKRALDEADKKSESRFKGMMEEINGNFGKVAEQFKGVFQKFDDIQSTQDEQTKTLLSQSLASDLQSKLLRSHTKKFDSNTETLGNAMIDITETKLDIKDIKYDIKLRLDNKLDKKYFVEMDRRVRVLEKK